VSAPSYLLARPDGSTEGRSTRPAIYRAVAADTYSVSSNGSSGGDGKTLTGYFAVFDRWTEINSSVEGHFMELVARGAFRKTLRERGTQIPVMFSHGHDPQLGLQVVGQVRDLAEDENGVRYTVDLFDGLPPLLLEGLRAGSYGASFRAKLVKDRYTARPGRSEHNPSGLPESIVTELSLREFGPTSIPAYTDTTAEIRSVTDQYVPRVRLEAGKPKPRRALPEPLPSWHLGSDEAEPYWLLTNREDQRAHTSAHQT